MKDIHGNTLTVGARVYIRPRPSRLSPNSEISGKGGQVKRLLEPTTKHGDLVEVLTYPDGGVRTVRAAEISIQHGRSRAQEEFEAVWNACPGPSRRGR